MNDLPDRHAEVLRRALGLDKSDAPSKNRFAAYPGCIDWEGCRALVESGLMRDDGPLLPRPLFGPARVFRVTEAGAKAVGSTLSRSIVFNV
ncbi:MAG: hypothetical protein AAFR28_18500 [Pseudomonadota bacterium]